MKLFFPDSKIIEALKSSDDHEVNKIFRYLYRTYYGMALQFVRSNKGNESDAEDVFQDALVGFYQNVRKGIFRGDSSVKTYLYSMIRNQWLVRLKKNRRNIPMENPDFDATDAHFLQNENPAKTLTELVDSMLEQVGDRCREILKLYYFDNLSMREIARLADFDNENSAKTQKYKCIQRIIRVIADKPELKKVIFELLADNE